MKRIAFGLLTLALTLVACNKNDINLSPVDNNVETNEGIPFTATISAGDNVVTRALTESGNTLVATWKVGEKVALVHNSRKDEMTVSEVNDGVATITGTITGSPSTGDAVIIIYPYTAADGSIYEATGDLRDNVLGSQANPQNGKLTGSDSIAEKYDVRKGSGTLKVSDGTASLNGNVSLANQFAIFKFTVRQYNGTTAIRTKRLTITADGHKYFISNIPTDVLYVALPAVDGKKVIFDVMADDGRNSTYTCAKLNTTFAAGKFYQVTLKMRQYALMGGVKWAVCNIGATNPQDYGDYYSWGATATQTTYNWANYPHMQADQSDSNHINKYTIADGWYNYGSPIWYDGSTFKGDNGDGVEYKDLASYGYVDDVARQQWGGTWRIPTEDERQALKNPENFTWEWTTDYKGTGVTGMLVTCNNTDDYGIYRQIFLPAAGYYDGSSLNDKGYWGHYWTSSLSNYTISAWNLGVSSAGPGGGAIYRYYGYSVRPVAE